MLYGIYTIRQIDTVCKTVFVADKDISFGIFGIIETACTFEIYGKGSTGFGCFNFGTAVIAVLDNCNFACDYLFIYIEKLGIKFDSIIFCLAIYIIFFGIEQVTFRGRDFLNIIGGLPAVHRTRIVVGNKIAVAVCNVGVDQCTVLIKTVNSTAECGIAGVLAIRFSQFINNRIRFKRLRCRCCIAADIRVNLELQKIIRIPKARVQQLSV